VSLRHAAAALFPWSSPPEKERYFREASTFPKNISLATPPDRADRPLPHPAAPA